MKWEHEDIQAVWDTIIAKMPERHREACAKVLRRYDSGIGANSSSVYPKWSKLALKVVSLREHTLDVVRAAAKDQDPTMTTYSLGIIAACGHDVAKIRGYLDRRSVHDKRLHAVKGAAMMRDWLQGLLLESELEMVCAAIRFHHEPADELTPAEVAEAGGLLELLKNADDAAREQEVDKVGGEVVGKEGRHFVFPQSGGCTTEETKAPRVKKAAGRVPDPSNIKLSWFSPLGLVARLAPYLNTDKGYTGGPAAITMRRTAYISVPLIERVLTEWSRELDKAVFDLWAGTGDTGRRQDALAWVVGELTKAGLVQTQKLGPGYFFQLFEVEFGYRGKGRRKPLEIPYVPLQAECFGDLDELEARKQGTGHALVQAIKRVFRARRTRTE